MHFSRTITDLLYQNPPEDSTLKHPTEDHPRAARARNCHAISGVAVARCFDEVKRSKASHEEK